MKKTEASHSPVVRGGDIMLAILWFGLLAGLIEGLVMVARKYALGTHTALGPHVLWMAPAMDVLWLLVPGIILAALVRFWRSPRALRVAVFGLAFPAAVAVTFLAINEIHTYSLILIALGIAVEVSFLAVRHPRGFVRMVQWSTPLLLVLTAISAGVALGLDKMAERRSLARLPPAPEEAPNVLLLILDTARALSMSVNGYGLPTSPRLEEFARRGVNFMSAYSPSSWTLPSHASMFTGYLPHQMSSGLRTPLDDTYPTLAEELSQKGYLTGGFVANLHYASRDFGLQRGFAHYEDYAISLGELFLNSTVGRYLSVRPDFRRLIGYYDILGRKNAALLGRNLLSWIDGKEDGRPFFAFVNFYDAHEPYLPPPEFDRKFASATPRKLYQTDQSIRGARQVGKPRLTRGEVRREHEAYSASLAYLDHEIGRLLDSLESRGLLQNTIVIITSDHGEQFGEHGYFVHGNSLYAPVMRVPFILSFPRIVPLDVEVASRFNLRDVASTVLDLTNVQPTHAFPGRSLRRFWDSTRVEPAQEPLLFEVITTGKPVGIVEELRSVVWRDHEYIRHEDGREELYNLALDSSEVHDLVKEQGDTTPMIELRAIMDSLLLETGEDVWGP